MAESSRVVLASGKDHLLLLKEYSSENSFVIDQDEIRKDFYDLPQQIAWWRGGIRRLEWKIHTSEQSISTKYLFLLNLIQRRNERIKVVLVLVIFLAPQLW